MNIFKYLNLPENFRKENKVTQLVKHWDEVVEKNKEGKSYGVQNKADGVCGLILVTKEDTTIWSRTGKKLKNTEQLEEDIHRKMPAGVYLAEITCDQVSLEVLSGIISPNRVKPVDRDKVHIPSLLVAEMYDMITLEEFVEGKSSRSFKERFSLLKYNVLCTIHHPAIQLLDVVELDTESEIRTVANSAISSGEEGIVIRDLDADWVAGHKGYRVMKIVCGVDYDLLCTGYEEGTGKYAGKVANLLFRWKGGKTIKCMLGKGWTHEMAGRMFNDMGTLDTVVGKVFQVYALMESSKGKLRLPKVGELRHDKDEADV